MNAMGIIFANDGTMGALTEKRTMASLPFGAWSWKRAAWNSRPPTP